MTVRDQILQRMKHTAKRLKHLKRVQQALIVLQRQRQRALERLHTPPTRKNPPLDIFGVDYAWGRVPYDALKRAGVKYALRYISHDAGKDLTLAERRALKGRGIKVGLVFETTANRALSGRDGGIADAKFSQARCKSLGLADIPVFFAVDWDATDADKPRIADYLKGAVSVLGRERVGVYGSFYVVRYMADHGVCDYFWQTYAWSGGLVHDQAHVLQYRNGQNIGGLSLDYNKARSLAWAR